MLCKVGSFTDDSYSGDQKFPTSKFLTDSKKSEFHYLSEHMCNNFYKLTHPVFMTVSATGVPGYLCAMET